MTQNPELSALHKQIEDLTLLVKNATDDTNPPKWWEEQDNRISSLEVRMNTYQGYVEQILGILIRKKDGLEPESPDSQQVKTSEPSKPDGKQPGAVTIINEKSGFTYQPEESEILKSKPDEPPQKPKADLQLGDSSGTKISQGALVDERRGSFGSLGSVTPRPRIELPIIEGTNPKGWIQKCIKFFHFYGVIAEERGAMAAMHNGEDFFMSNFVSALKEELKHRMTTTIVVEDVRREVKILQALIGHSNLVKFYDAFEDHDNVYIVMELCEGGELLDRMLARGGKYTEDDAKGEENSLLKAIDFGLSDFVRPDERLNDIVGSAYYVVPEVLHRSYGTEADVWSIGVIAYILLCGSRPLWARKKSGIFRAVLKADPNFNEPPWPSLSLEAEDFVKRLLIKDPRKRMTAAQALSHPWIQSIGNVKALSKTLTPDELFYLGEQFSLLEPKHGSITLENIKTTLMKNATDASSRGVGVILSQEGTYEDDLLAKEWICVLSIHPQSDSNWKYLGGILRYQSRVYVGFKGDLRFQILSNLHDSSQGGHSGVQATYQRIKAHFYWSGLKTMVVVYVRKCDNYQRIKVDHIPKTGLLQPLPVPNQAWEIITMDFTDGLPKSNQKNCILVMVDKFTKYTHFLPLSHPYTAMEVAHLYLDHIFKLHGQPNMAISDRDKTFISLFWHDLMKQLGTSTFYSTAYLPKTDGQTEQPSILATTLGKITRSSEDNFLSLILRDKDRFMEGVLLWLGEKKEKITERMNWEIQGMLGIRKDGNGLGILNDELGEMRTYDELEILPADKMETDEISFGLIQAVTQQCGLWRIP
ncbi:CDPK-related protein kinase [Hibiscus syriacus]|uniref:CDPK-related protein kinase n=1 Tax=Hibiscus syriacus TaxID=106335 RepID=A0A6A3BU26_HIBSY|nr:CDPK-related protein kinase [Hibiscus syriacus]